MNQIADKSHNSLRIMAFVMVFFIAMLLGVSAPTSAQAASQIKVIVNKQAITSTDISRRKALLRLQQRKGNLSALAKEDLIEEALKMQEIKRLRATASQQEVDAAFGRFASANNLSVKRMSSILSQAGVTARHFKQFIAVQLGWERVLSARYGTTNGGRLSNQELVSKMLERGNDKATTTEYVLQQVIFVVPQSKRSKSYLNRRNSEARNFRPKIQSCETTKSQTKGLRDVTVRNLGRFLKPELPPEWSPLISKTDINKPTRTRVTDKGVEFLVICKSRQVSDDVAAEMVFRSEQQGSELAQENSKKFVEELRKRAVIINR